MAIIAQKMLQSSQLCLILIVAYMGSCQSIQNDVDTELVHACRDAKIKVKKYYKTDSTKALLTVRKLERAFPHADFASINAHISYAAVYERWGNKQLAKQHANVALEIAQRCHFYQEEAQVYLQKLELADNDEEALQYLQKFEALQQTKGVNDPSLLFRYYYDFGYYHYELNDYLSAKSYFLKSLNMSRKHKWIFEESQSLNALSMVLNNEKKYIPALALIDRAIEIGLRSNPIECGDHYYQKGVILSEMKQYKAAEIAILEAQKIYDKHPHPYRPGIIEVVLGDVYMNQKKYKEALQAYTVFLNNAQFTSTKIWAYNTLANYYVQTNDYEQVLAYHKKSEQLKDSTYSVEKVYLLTAKKAQFELAQQELLFKTTQLHYQFWLIIATILVVAITTLIVFIYYNSLLERKLTDAEQINLQQKIEINQRKLATSSFHLSHYKDSLRDLRKGILKLNDDAVLSTKTQIKEILKSIDSNLNDEDEWDKFKLHFEAVSPLFFEILKARTPKLTELDLKHCAYLKINLTPKQVAQLLGISPKSVTLSRVRIKKKLQLNEEEQLIDFLQKI